MCYAMEKARAVWKCDCNGQGCKRSGCYNYAVHAGASWNQKLGCEGKDALARFVTFLQQSVEANALAINGPVQLSVAMTIKERVGKD